MLVSITQIAKIQGFQSLLPYKIIIIIFVINFLIDPEKVRCMADYLPKRIETLPGIGVVLLPVCQRVCSNYCVVVALSNKIVQKYEIYLEMV